MLHLRPFGSSRMAGQQCSPCGDPAFLLSLRLQVCHPTTRILVALLGPCFKTGRLKPFCQQPLCWVGGGKPQSRSRAKSWKTKAMTRLRHRTYHPQGTTQQSSIPSSLGAKSYNTTAKGRCYLLLARLGRSKLLLTCLWHECTGPKGPADRARAQQSFQAFPFQQFHVLLNSLFRVLFIFPSRYLFAIGLLRIFSLGWNLPPVLDCIPKQSDSSKNPHNRYARQPKTGFSPSVTKRRRSAAVFQRTFCPRAHQGEILLQITTR
jgi:hypothetical protein